MVSFGPLVVSLLVLVLMVYKHNSTFRSHICGNGGWVTSMSEFACVVVIELVVECWGDDDDDDDDDDGGGGGRN